MSRVSSSRPGTSRPQSSVLSQSDLRTLIRKVWSNVDIVVEFCNPIPASGRFLSCRTTRSGHIKQVVR